MPYQINIDALLADNDKEDCFFFAQALNITSILSSGFSVSLNRSPLLWQLSIEKERFHNIFLKM